MPTNKYECNFLTFDNMAIAISDSNLKEIYNLSYEEKLDLVDLIIKSMRTATKKIKQKTAEPTNSWVDQFEGRWIDSKSADDMVKDLRNSRTNNSTIDL